MPLVLVHGVPDTHRVWNSVVSRIERDDVLTLSLPGFDSAVPDNFSATKEEYVDWLLDELSKISEPIDLVGHDWGALLVLRAISLRPEMVRSWAAGAAPLDSEYVWHQAAQLWQTPEVGEKFMESLTPEAIKAALVAGGAPERDAAETAKYVDETMKSCILNLYRSAVNVGAEWENDLQKITAPGVILWGDKDPYVTTDFGERLATRTKAKFVMYEDCAHWWQLQRPDEVAAELKNLWSKTSS